jgi:hypothetical protein
MLKGLKPFIRKICFFAARTRNADHFLKPTGKPSNNRGFLRFLATHDQRLAKSDLVISHNIGRIKDRYNCKTPECTV